MRVLRCLRPVLGGKAAAGVVAALAVTLSGGQAVPAAGKAAASSILYSTLVGGGGDDIGLAVAVDASGSSYVAGRTESGDFPTSSDAPLPSFQGGVSDAFVAKFDTGGRVVYATYLGGSGEDEARGIAVGADGALYVSGFTSSPDLPAAGGRGYAGGLDAFLTKIGPNGSIAWSRYLGGAVDDRAVALALDGGDNAYLTGEAQTGFPTTAGAFQPGPGGDFDAFAAKFTPGGALVYSTFLGGPGFDDGLAIAVDGSGEAFVTGKASPGFPVTAGSFDVSQNGGFDMFVTKLSPTGSSLAYSTYLGGANWDEGLGIATDASGDAFVTGNVQSSDFPTTPGAYDRTLSGAVNTGIAELDPAGSSLLYSTFLGGSGTTEADALALGADGSVVVAGHTDSPNLPVTADAVQPALGGVYDGWVAKIGPGGGALHYATYFGGSGWDSTWALTLDGAGTPYVTGTTASPNLPGAARSPTGSTAGGYDAFAAAVRIGAPVAVVVSSFSGRREGRGVRLTWRTRAEAGLAGFELRRGSMKLNRRLIRTAGPSAGALYRYADRRAPAAPTTYRLYGIGLDGKARLLAALRVA